MMNGDLQSTGMNEWCYTFSIRGAIQSANHRRLWDVMIELNIGIEIWGCKGISVGLDWLAGCSSLGSVWCPNCSGNEGDGDEVIYCHIVEFFVSASSLTFPFVANLICIQSKVKYGNDREWLAIKSGKVSALGAQEGMDGYGNYWD